MNLEITSAKDAYSASQCTDFRDIFHNAYIVYLKKGESKQLERKFWSYATRYKNTQKCRRSTDIQSVIDDINQSIETNTYDMVCAKSCFYLLTGVTVSDYGKSLLPVKETIELQVTDNQIIETIEVKDKDVLGCEIKPLNTDYNKIIFAKDNIDIQLLAFDGGCYLRIWNKEVELMDEICLGQIILEDGNDDMVFLSVHSYDGNYGSISQDAEEAAEMLLNEWLENNNYANIETYFDSKFSKETIMPSLQKLGYYISPRQRRLLKFIENAKCTFAELKKAHSEIRKSILTKDLHYMTRLGIIKKVNDKYCSCEDIEKNELQSIDRQPIAPKLLSIKEIEKDLGEIKEIKINEPPILSIDEAEKQIDKESQ
ncbi:MAG: hypothetical protein RLZZ628_3210, partial [Bacteroidota bacterium]